MGEVLVSFDFLIGCPLVVLGFCCFGLAMGRAGAPDQFLVLYLWSGYGCLVPSWCLLGAFLVPGAWCLVLGAWCLVPPLLGAFLVPSAWCLLGAG